MAKSSDRKKGGKRKRGNMSESPKNNAPKKFPKVFEIKETPKRPEVNTPIRNLAQSSQDNLICGTCHEGLDRRNKNLLCGECKGYFHTLCVNFNEKDLDCLLKIQDKVLWKCVNCENSVKELKKKNDDLERKMIILEEELRKVKEALVNGKEIISEAFNEETDQDSSSKPTTDIINESATNMKEFKKDMIKEIRDRVEEQIRNELAKFKELSKSRDNN